MEAEISEINIGKTSSQNRIFRFMANAVSAPIDGKIVALGAAQFWGHRYSWKSAQFFGERCSRKESYGEECERQQFCAQACPARGGSGAMLHVGIAFGAEILRRQFFSMP